MVPLTPFIVLLLIVYLTTHKNVLMILICKNLMQRLHYVPGGHGNPGSDDREQNGVNVG